MATGLPNRPIFEHCGEAKFEVLQFILPLGFDPDHLGRM